VSGTTKWNTLPKDAHDRGPDSKGPAVPLKGPTAPSLPAWFILSGSVLILTNVATSPSTVGGLFEGQKLSSSEPVLLQRTIQVDRLGVPSGFGLVGNEPLLMDRKDY